MKLKLCKADAVDEAAMIQVTVPGKPPFAVYKVEGCFHVTDDTCTHGKSSLADEGELEGHCITCTWHDGKFDIRSGAALCAPCIVPLRVYPVSVEDDTVFIDVE